MSTDDSFKKNRRFSRLAPTILLLRIDDSFRKHRRLFFKSPWMLGEVNQLHFQKESFPAFTGLFFSSSTESADNLTEVILHQQTPATRPSCFLLTKRSYRTYWTLVICRAVPRLMLALLEDGHQWDGVSPLDWHPARKETKVPPKTMDWNNIQITRRKNYRFQRTDGMVREQSTFRDSSSPLHELYRQWFLLLYCFDLVNIF